MKNLNFHSLFFLISSSLALFYVDNLIGSQKQEKDPFEFHQPESDNPDSLPHPPSFPDSPSEDSKNQVADEFPFINLEEKAQDFVLETKEIKIPGFKYSFNPTITRWKGNLLMAFRVRDPQKLFLTNQIGLVWLDENFKPIGQPYILVIPRDSDSYFKEQDPRLITIQDRLYIVYSNLAKGITVSEVRRMFVSEIHFDGENFFTDPPECLSSFGNEREQRWEKNWVPFEYEGNLLLAYSLTPHRILKLLGNEKCETYASTLGHIQWDWGVLRGGTPALLDGDNYLGIFHSSKHMETSHSQGKNITHYFMGAYTFSNQPPFEITQISPEPIIGNDFYTSPIYKTWKPLKVIFPCGLLIDENYIWVFYGKQDFEIWVAKLDKKKLMKNLIPVSSILNSP